jgi:hypothetical protein
LSDEEETILLQTPTTVQTDEPPERMRARAERNGYKNGTKFGSLTSQIKYDERVAMMLGTPTATSGNRTEGFAKGRVPSPKEFARDYAAMLLPTPLVVEREHPESVEALKATGATKINSRANGEQRPNGIVDFMNFYGMLPTPEASMWKDQTITESTARMGDLHQERLPRKLAKDIRAMDAFPTDGQPFRLSPLFTEEMMGFPFLWTTLPFLRPSGEPKPSKPTEMR